MNVTLGNHPAQARHPVTRDPLWDDDGNPVPLVTTQKAVFLDKYLIGYCGLTPEEPISIIKTTAQIPPAARDEIIAKVKILLGGNGDETAKVSQAIPDVTEDEKPDDVFDD